MDHETELREAGDSCLETVLGLVMGIVCLPGSAGGRALWQIHKDNRDGGLRGYLGPSPHLRELLVSSLPPPHTLKSTFLFKWKEEGTANPGG